MIDTGWLFGNLLRALNLMYMYLVSQIRYELSVDPQSNFLKTLPLYKLWILKAFSRKKTLASTDTDQNTPGGDAMKLMTSRGPALFSTEEDKDQVQKNSHLHTQNTEHSETAVKVLDLTGEIPVRSLIIWISSFLTMAVTGLIIEIILGSLDIIPNISKKLADEGFSALYITSCNPDLLLVRYILQASIIVLTVLIMISIRDIEDTMNFRNEILVTSLINVSLITWYLTVIFATKSGDASRFTLSGGFISVLANIVQHTVTVVWPLIQARKDELRMKNIGNLESGFGTIDAMLIVLDKPQTFLAFKKELQLQFCKHLRLISLLYTSFESIIFALYSF